MSTRIVLTPQEREKRASRTDAMMPLFLKKRNGILRNDIISLLDKCDDADLLKLLRKVLAPKSLEERQIRHMWRTCEASEEDIWFGRVYTMEEAMAGLRESLRRFRLKREREDKSRSASIKGVEKLRVPKRLP